MRASTVMGLAILATAMQGVAMQGAGQGAHAADLGVVGALFEVTEPNLLVALYKRFDQLEAEGAVEALREDMTDRTKSYVLEPRPVLGITKVTEASVRYFDPSITVDADIADHRGVVFARRGTVINPLDHVTAPVPTMLMIDGADDAQVQWAMGQGDEIDSRIILISGRPIDLTKKHRRRFYFDQDGIISNRFGVMAAPTMIERDGRQFRITEVALP